MDKSEGPPESVLRLLAVAIGWFLLAAMPTALIALIFPIADIAQRNPDWPPGVGSPLKEIGELGIYGIMFLAAYVRGPVVGNGDVRAGLGYEAVHRKQVCQWLAVLILIHAVGWQIFFYEVGRDLIYKQLIINTASLWLILYAACKTILLAPLMEELNIRGWLWTGLRKHWGPFSTAALTCVIWLPMHGLGARLILLLPVAIILSVARHFGGSVRASIALHILNNSIVVIFPWALKATGLL